MLQRSDHASWLNPVLHADAYYVHALAVKRESRGKLIGYELIDAAINRAKEQGYKWFKPNVLSNIPAVGFTALPGQNFQPRLVHPNVRSLKCRLGIEWG